MPEPPFDVQKAHRWFAVELNNQAWDLLEKKDRTPEETERMVHSAHASCLHWLADGTLLNHQRAQHLLASVYSAAGDGASALRHAKRCKELSGANGDSQTNFDRACVSECIARGLACAGELDEARRLKQEAGRMGEQIESSEDRAIFLQMLAAGEWRGVE